MPYCFFLSLLFTLTNINKTATTFDSDKNGLDSMNQADYWMEVCTNDKKEIMTITVGKGEVSENRTFKGWYPGFKHPYPRELFQRVRMACRIITDMTHSEYEVECRAAHTLLRTLDEIHAAQTGHEPITVISRHEDDHSETIIGTDSLAQCSAFGSETPQADHLFSTYASDDEWVLQHQHPHHVGLQTRSGVVARSSRHPDRVLHLRVDAKDGKHFWTARMYAPTAPDRWPMVTEVSDVKDPMPDGISTALEQEIESNPGQCEYLFESKENWETFKASTLRKLFHVANKALQLSQSREREVSNISEM